MTSLSSPELLAVVIQVMIALLVLRRSYAMAQGVPFSALRLAALPALVLILWGLSELESTFLIPWALPYLILVDVAILVGTSLALTPAAQRMTQAYRGGSGDWSYRVGFSLAAVFVSAFVVRLVVAVVLFPGALEFGSPPGGFPSMQEQIALGVIDAIFSVSAGLLVARSIGIRREVDLARARTATSDSG